MSDEIEPIGLNDQLVLVCGYSGMGKSASLRNIRNQEKWLYLNTEAGKRLPFKNKFQVFKITDPMEVMEAFDYGTDNPDVEGVICDSLNFLMDMYESQYVLTSSNTMKAWGDYNQFLKELMQQKVAKFNKPTIFTAHVKDDLDEASMQIKTSVPVKGALKGAGIEAFFSTVVSAKRVPLKELAKVNSLLDITEDEQDVGFKHVFQTRINKNSLGERIRAPMGMFSRDETFIDNDVQKLLDRLVEFYK